MQCLNSMNWSNVQVSCFANTKQTFKKNLGMLKLQLMSLQGRNLDKTTYLNTNGVQMLLRTPSLLTSLLTK